MEADPSTTLLRSLRATRQFSPQPIPDSMLIQIADTARWTGSAKNSQPWRLIVVRTRETLERLSRLGRDADHVARAPAAVALVIEGEDGDADISFDAGRLAQTVMLAASAHGVGSCIASLFPAENRRRAMQLLAVPEGNSLRTVISLGYPARPDSRQLPGRAILPRGRKPLATILSWERFGCAS